jgi:hypothetical protein
MNIGLGEVLRPRLHEQILFDKFDLIKCIWSKASIMLTFVQMHLSQIYYLHEQNIFDIWNL